MFVVWVYGSGLFCAVVCLIPEKYTHGAHQSTQLSCMERATWCSIRLMLSSDPMCFCCCCYTYSSRWLIVTHLGQCISQSNHCVSWIQYQSICDMIQLAAHILNLNWIVWQTERMPFCSGWKWSDRIESIRLHENEMWMKSVYCECWWPIWIELHYLYLVSLALPSVRYELWEIYETEK